ncbi:uncharacterized protein LOC144508037 [Mustelus asterias]
MFKTSPPPTGKVIGKGTALKVIVQPSLWLFASSDEAASSPSLTVTCSAYRFYPNVITVMFQTTCLSNQLTNESSLNLDGTYNHTAIINISTKTCTNSAKFTCVIQHPASQSKIQHTICIDAHKTGEGHNGQLWTSICSGTACIILLVLFFLKKCTCERKGTQEQKGTQASHGRLHRRQDNTDENNGSNIYYAELELGNLQKVRKKEEEIVYSTVLFSKSDE